MQYRIEQYKSATNKLVLLDYDGTLVNFAGTPDAATPSEQIVNLLLKLNSKPQTSVVIITGRGYQDIERLIGHLPIKIIAEHGAWIKEDATWKVQVEDAGLWKKEINPILNSITVKCPNSFIEEKHFSLSWHYRNAEPQTGYACSRELIRRLEKEIISYNLKIIDGSKVIEVVNKQTDKGKATCYLLGKNNYDFVLSIGDDKTDEDMFEVLTDNKKHLTIKVGEGNTYAMYKLSNVNDVITLLEQL